MSECQARFQEGELTFPPCSACVGGVCPQWSAALESAPVPRWIDEHCPSAFAKQQADGSLAMDCGPCSADDPCPLLTAPPTLDFSLVNQDEDMGWWEALGDLLPEQIFQPEEPPSGEVLLHFLVPYMGGNPVEESLIRLPDGRWAWFDSIDGTLWLSPGPVAPEHLAALRAKFAALPKTTSP